jgi:hypothetical protein
VGSIARPPDHALRLENALADVVRQRLVGHTRCVDPVPCRSRDSAPLCGSAVSQGFTGPTPSCRPGSGPSGSRSRQVRQELHRGLDARSERLQARRVQVCPSSPCSRSARVSENAARDDGRDVPREQLYERCVQAVHVRFSRTLRRGCERAYQHRERFRARFRWANLEVSRSAEPALTERAEALTIWSSVDPR